MNDLPDFSRCGFMRASALGLGAGMGLLEAIYISAERGEWVEVNPDGTLR